MPTIATRVLSLIRDRRETDELGHCLVCRRRVGSSDERLRVRAGGYVHRGCSTYRMRQRELVQRRLRA
jgi:hypothetical protein